MGRITHHTTKKDHEIAGTTGKCQLCDSDSCAFWFGIHTIEVCPTCAVEILPALIADAMHLHHGSPAVQQAEQKLKDIERVFWKAVASRAWAEGREVRP